MSYRKKFIVEPGEKVNLDKIDPSYHGKHESHEKALPEIRDSRLYCQLRRSVVSSLGRSRTSKTGRH